MGLGESTECGQSAISLICTRFSHKPDDTAFFAEAYPEGYDTRVAIVEDPFFVFPVSDLLKGLFQTVPHFTEFLSDLDLEDISGVGGPVRI